jgi:flagellar FliJ protein
MTATFNLQRLLEFAEQQSETAAASLGTLNRELVREQEKHALLVRYRSEYQERLRVATARGIDGAALRNFHDFLERLEAAIVQQQRKVEECQARTAGSRREWQNKQRTFKAFDTLSQRFQSAVQRREARHEQKATDEIAADRRRRRPGQHR